MSVRVPQFAVQKNGSPAFFAGRALPKLSREKKDQRVVSSISFCDPSRK